MGRATRLTPAVHQQIVEAKRLGLPNSKACGFAGIPAVTFYSWIDSARKSREAGTHDRHVALLDDIEKAEATLVAESLQRIRKAGTGGEVLEETTTTRTARDGTVTTEVHRKLSRPEWQALAWVLERRFPDDFSQRYRTEVVSGESSTDALKIEIVNKDPAA